MKNILRLLVLSLFAAFVSAFAFPVKKADPAGFKIRIEKTPVGIKLIGEKGTAFKELSFSVKYDSPRVIDQFGMVPAGQSKVDSKNPELSDFQFAIQKTKDGFTFHGKRGTRWTDLKFSFQDQLYYLVIDESGGETFKNKVCGAFLS